MRVLFSSTCKPIPVFLDRFLSIDDVSYRFIVDQGPFSATADVPCFSLHFLAQNVACESTVLEWPEHEELVAELKSKFYDYIAISSKIIDMDHLAEMIPIIRRASPATKIVLGGYCTLGLNEPEFSHVRDGVDHICWTGDGVKFMRNLLGEPLNRGIQAHLPVENIRIPWMSELGSTFASGVQAGYLLSALGCVWKCEFCATSAYTKGQTVDVMTPEEILDSMKHYYRTNISMKHVFVMDEELLLRKHKVNALGKLIREDQEFGLGTMTYLAFGTIKALSRWDPEELLLNGVGETWTGIESKFSYNKKKGEVDQHDLIRNLAAVGIEPQLSWIIGDDCQTKENIEEDVDYLISLEPVTTQLTTLLAFPGTALYKRLKDSNRLVGDNSSSREYHLFGNNMSSLHFNHDERVATILQTYDRIYEKLGPSSMRSINVYLNGYEYCAKSKNPMLNTQKKAFFKKRIDSGAFLLKTAIEFAPAAEAKQVLQNTLDRYISIFGPMRKSAQVLSEKAYQLASREMERRKIDGPPTSIREVPLKRYEYAGQPIELIDGIPTANMAALPPDVPLSSLSSF